MPAFAGSYGGRGNKELPQNFGKAKVREFDNRKNFAQGIFDLFSVSSVQRILLRLLRNFFVYLIYKIKKSRISGILNSLSCQFFFFSFYLCQY
jgi:hypothetical protein